MEATERPSRPSHSGLQTISTSKLLSRGQISPRRETPPATSRIPHACPRSSNPTFLDPGAYYFRSTFRQKFFHRNWARLCRIQNTENVFNSFAQTVKWRQPLHSYVFTPNPSQFKSDKTFVQARSYKKEWQYNMYEHVMHADDQKKITIKLQSLIHAVESKLSVHFKK